MNEFDDDDDDDDITKYRSKSFNITSTDKVLTYMDLIQIDSDIDDDDDDDDDDDLIHNVDHDLKYIDLYNDSDIDIKLCNEQVYNITNEFESYFKDIYNTCLISFEQLDQMDEIELLKELIISKISPNIRHICTTTITAIVKELNELLHNLQKMLLNVIIEHSSCYINQALFIAHLCLKLSNGSKTLNELLDL